MASRNFDVVQHSATKGVVSVYFKVTFDGTSAPTLGTGAGNIGVKSITRTDTGDFSIVFGTPSGIADTYLALLSAQCVFEGASPDAPILTVSSSSALSTTGTLAVTFLNGSLAATDPGTGEIGYFRVDLRNSSAI